MMDKHPEVDMKLHKKISNDRKVAMIEAALQDLPCMELPPYVEQRILAAVRDAKSVKKRSAIRPLSGLQWASLALGIMIGVYCGTMFNKVTDSAGQNHSESVFGFYEVSEPSLLDLY